MPVIIVVLQGRKLCKQVFVYMIWGPLSFTGSCCARLYLIERTLNENASAGKLTAGRKVPPVPAPFLLCSLLAQVLGLVQNWSLSFAISTSSFRWLLLSSLCPVHALWLVPGEWKNLLECLSRLPPAEFDLCACTWA